MQNLENLDIFEILITQNLLKCRKDPFVRSALIPSWESVTIYELVFLSQSSGVNFLL